MATSRSSKKTVINQTSSLIPHLDDVSSETTLLEVKKTIEKTNKLLNDVTLGSISVQSVDTIAHTKLDTLNTSLINKHLNLSTDSINISGQSVLISNLPSVQAVSGTFWPSTQQISGDVNASISGQSVMVSNFPTSFDISSLPSITIENTSFNVGNFPTVQAVSGDVNISGQSVLISNLPSVQAVSGTFWPSTQQISGDVNASISGQSVMVSNFPTSFDISSLPSITIENTSFNVGNFPTVQAVSGDVNILNLPSVQAVSGTFWPSTQQISGNVNASISGQSLMVSNFPTSFDISSLPSITIENTSFNVGNFPTVQAVSGDVNISGQSVLVNTISGFALDSTLQSTNTHLSSLNSTINNKHLDKTTDSINISGQSVLVNWPSVQTVIGTTNSTITNSFIDTHLYASTNGSTWHHLKADANGVLNVHSMVQDGAGNDISSTAQALDVNVKNTSNIPIDIKNISLASGCLPVALNDGFFNGITSTASSGHNSIDVNMVNALNISGQSVLVNTISGFALDSTLQSTNTQLTTLHTDLSNTSNGLPSIQSAITDLNADLTNSLNVVTTAITDLNADLYQGSTTNYNAQSGLNVCQIIPKTKSYTIGGFDANGTIGNCLIAGYSTSNISASTYNFGGAFARPHFAILTTASTRVLYYDYVATNGDLVENAVATINNSTATNLGTFISIVDFRLASSLVSGEFLYIGLSSTVATLKATSLYYEDINVKAIGVFTVPNGYVGHLNYVSSYVASASTIQLNRWNTNGIRQTIWRVNNTGNVNVSSGYDGSLTEFIKAGETIAFSSQLAVAGKSVIASILLKSIL